MHKINVGWISKMQISSGIKPVMIGFTRLHGVSIFMHTIESVAHHLGPESCTRSTSRADVPPSTHHLPLLRTYPLSPSIPASVYPYPKSMEEHALAYYLLTYLGSTYYSFLFLLGCLHPTTGFLVPTIKKQEDLILLRVKGKLPPTLSRFLNGDCIKSMTI